MVRYLKAVKAEFCFFGGVGRGQPNSTTSLHHCTRGRGGGGGKKMQWLQGVVAIFLSYDHGKTYGCPAIT